MSIKRLHKCRSSERSIKRTTNTYYDMTPNPIVDVWQRNQHWLDLPTINNTDEIYAGLMTIEDTTMNHVRVYVTTSGGQSQVDWGDGTVQTYDSNATAEHTYDYNDSNLDGTNKPVTFGSDTVTLTNHGYSNNDRISFYESSVSTVERLVYYYVVNAQSNTFQLALSEGGSPITIASGTGVILPYKQAIITITPVGDASIIGLRTDLKHSLSLYRYVSNFRDIAFSLPNATDIDHGTSSDDAQPLLIEKINAVHLGSAANFSDVFRTMHSLRSLTFGLYTGPGVNNSLMFYENYSIQYIPDLPWTVKGDQYLYFGNCFSLREIPNYDSHDQITRLHSCFSYCLNIKRVNVEAHKNLQSTMDIQNVHALNYSLQAVPGYNTVPTDLYNSFNSTQATTLPYFDTSGVTRFQQAFESMRSLCNIPAYDTSSSTNFHRTFEHNGLKGNLPYFDFSSATRTDQCFRYMYGLKNIRYDINIPNATRIDYMFHTCNTLQKGKIITSSALTTAYQAYTYTRSMKNIDVFDVSGVTGANGRYLFHDMRRLKTLPNFNFASATDLDHLAQSCYSLKRVEITNSSLPLVQDLYNSFSNCFSLKSVAFDNIPEVLTFNRAFYNCYSLKTMQITVPKATRIDYAFYNAMNMEKLEFNAPLATEASQAISGNTYGGRSRIHDIKGDFSSAVNNEQVFLNLYALRKLRATFTNNVYLQKLYMTGEGINEFYTYLPTVSGKTINVSNNRGRLYDDPTIATAKGWTVTG